MKMYEAALYKLAGKQKITPEQAKILKTLYEKKACSTPIIMLETGLKLNSATIELNELMEKRIIERKQNIFFVPQFEEKIAQLIHNEELHGTIRLNQRAR